MLANGGFQCLGRPSANGEEVAKRGELRLHVGGWLYLFPARDSLSLDIVAYIQVRRGAFLNSADVTPPVMRRTQRSESEARSKDYVILTQTVA